MEHLQKAYQYTLATLLVIGMLPACVKDRVETPLASSGIILPGNKTLIHYWNFNDSGTLLTPTSTIGNASITVGGAYDEVTPGTLLNARNSNDSASALRIRNPSTTMILKAPTSGYKDVVLSFAVMRTSAGPQSNIISYTTDGTNYVSAGIGTNTLTITETWAAYSINFSAVPAANNNNNFAVKVTFDLGNTAATGNDRYDNITLDASSI